MALDELTQKDILKWHLDKGFIIYIENHGYYKSLNGGVMGLRQGCSPCLPTEYMDFEVWFIAVTEVFRNNNRIHYEVIQ